MPADRIQNPNRRKDRPLGGSAPIGFNPDVIFKVAAIYGSWTFSKSELIEIARLIVEAKVPLKKLVTNRSDSAMI